MELNAAQMIFLCTSFFVLGASLANAVHDIKLILEKLKNGKYGGKWR